MAKSLAFRLLYRIRDLRLRGVYTQIGGICHGRVLDVGGWDFFETARTLAWRFEHWTVLEPDSKRITPDPSVSIVEGDGCAMQFADASFDTILNIQVLEHVFEPNRMMAEMARVVSPGGHIAIIVPQTANVHMAPHNYYNFTKYWIYEAAARMGLEVVTLTPQGGVWSSIASRLIYFFPQSVRLSGMSSPEDRRSLGYYALYPLMAVFALLCIPICMLFSLADMSEEPNNHLAILRKPPDTENSPS